MKKFTIFYFAFIATLCSFILFSCSSTTSENVYSAGIAGTGKTAKLSEQDLHFLAKAYSLGLLKINLANEAQIRSTSAESNQLGRALTVFHSDLNTRIEKIADAHGFILPMDLTDDQKLVWKQLIKQKGWSFDKKFDELLRQLKEDETALFENAVKSSSNKAIKLLAQKSQPEFQLHETLQQTLSEKINERTMVAVKDEDSKDDKLKGKKRNNSKS